MVLGNNRRAKTFALEAVVSARRCGDRFIEGIALANVGRMDRNACRWSAAEEAASEALRIFEADGNARQTSIVRRTIAILQWKRGHLEASLSNAGRCIEDCVTFKDDLHEWLSHLLAGMVHLHMGAHVEARQLFTSGLSWNIPRAESRPSLLTTEFLGDIHLEQGQAEPALKHYDDVWPKALALVPKGDIVAELRRRRAECYYLLGRYDEAYAEATIGLEHCRELGDRYEEAATYRVLALAAAAVGKPAEAKRWFDQGFAYYDDIETPYEWGKLWMSYGDWLCGPHAGEYVDARSALEAYHAARDHFERMGAAAKLAEADARIVQVAAARSAAAGESPSAAAGVAAADLARPPRRPPRRPRGSAELDRRSAWASENFGFTTRSKLVLDLLTDVGKLASAGSPMLILGESGTGKELIAQGVHRFSGRTGNFVPINCGALPREVIESELFGHVAGAFTGATRDKAGLFEVCDHGTVFLDEIAEMTIESQSRLLRFLETGEIRRVGANRNLAVDTLVVAATNRERASLEKGERFRPDLYYRLAHAVVVLPPLRRRGEDIDLLVGHFLDESCRAQGKQVALSDGARNRLVAYPWPGNIRQLRAVMRRLVILAPPDHRIAADEVHLDDSDVASTLTEELGQAERRRMVEALAQSSGSRSDAARALGMARTTLVTKMKRYGIR
jgi:transcriptional regulator with AAA-type ATPase domain/tetratricopeptide (TPR) repeat protein